MEQSGFCRDFHKYSEVFNGRLSLRWANWPELIDCSCVMRYRNVHCTILFGSEQYWNVCKVRVLAVHWSIQRQAWSALHSPCSGLKQEPRFKGGVCPVKGRSDAISDRPVEKDSLQCAWWLSTAFDVDTQRHRHWSDLTWPTDNLHFPPVSNRSHSVNWPLTPLLLFFWFVWTLFLCESLSLHLHRKRNWI